MNKRTGTAISAAPLLFLLSAGAVSAQTVTGGPSPADEAGPATANVLDEVIVTGTRQGGLEAAEARRRFRS